MKKRFSAKEKANGERAVRLLSDKASVYYDQTDRLEVYQYEDKSGDALYAIRGFESRDGMTLDELEEYFEECFDDVQED